MISSRYHTLRGIASLSRSRFIHEELWQYTQRLIQRIILGQEKGPDYALRSIGSIEALLLMSEWHPQAIDLAPSRYGWDSELLVTNEQPTLKSNSWLEDVIEPTKRLDRMSWMLLGSAQLLGHELGIFREQREEDPSERAESEQFRRMKVRELLCIYVTLLAARLGCHSMIAITFSKSALSKLTKPSSRPLGAWIELMKLTKAVNGLLFPSASGTRELLRTGNYIDLLEHFQPLLDQWCQKHLDGSPRPGT